MTHKPVRRVVVLAAHVAVLSLATAPVAAAHAAPAADDAVEAADACEQVSVRLTNRKLHATVRAEAGRAVALVYADSADAATWTVLEETITEATNGGVAQILVDLADYEDQSLTLAVLTASDDAFETDLRATEAVELVLVDGTLYTPDELDDKSPLIAKGQVVEISAKVLTSLGDQGDVALKGMAVSYKTIAPDTETR